MLENKFELNHLNVHTDHYDDILFESILVNNNVQKLSLLSQDPTPTFRTINNILKLDGTNYSVVKISNLPDDVTISHGYNCNNSIYIPGCDIDRAALHFDAHTIFDFTAELFKVNIVEADKEFLCSLNKGKCEIEEKIKIAPSQHIATKDVRGLRNKIAEHYNTHSEKTVDLRKNHTHTAPIIDIQNALNNDVDAMTETIQNAAQERFYSVIKLCGLPKNMFENNVFYNDGAYFLTKDSVKNLKFKNVQKLKKKTEITIHFFGENTETPLKTLILHLENANAISASKIKKRIRARKKSA